MSHERVEHALRIGVVLVLAFAFVYVVESFSFTPSPQYALGSLRNSPRPASDSLTIESQTIRLRSVHCGPAIFDAWHSKSPPSGWFGYSPLTDSPVATQGSCRLESRHRVRAAAFGLSIGMGVLLAAWVIDRRRGFRPGPTAEPAT